MTDRTENHGQDTGSNDPDGQASVLCGHISIYVLMVIDLDSCNNRAAQGQSDPDY